MRKNLRPRAIAIAAAVAVTAAAVPAGVHFVSHAETASDSSSEKSSTDSSSKDNMTPPSGAPGGNMTPPSGAPGGGNGGTPPSGAPDGGPGGNGGTPPSGAPDGNGQGGNIPGGNGQGGGANTQSFDYTGTYSGKLVADGTEKSSSNETYESTDTDENAALAENGGTLTIQGDTFKKSGDDTNGDNCNFYGLNSTVLSVGSGSKVYIADSTSSSTSEGSNGYFATDSGAVYANNDKITTTTGGNARGLDATYGGTIIANKMTISTEKEHCAALATDRGGGNISVTNSTLKTAGSGSPLIYSTGDIETDNVEGTSSGSQIAGMEGLNTIYISNSKLTSTSDSRSGSDPIKDGVIIYQSTSGDAETTTGSRASFTAVDSTLKSAISDGAFFYVTNTSADVVLKGTTLDYSDDVDLIDAVGNSNNWGSTGSNGADLKFTGIGETLHGNIKVDTISTADIYLLEGTEYTGAVSIEENSDAKTESDTPVTINVDASSKWIVTDDSAVTDLNVAEGGKIVDTDGKTVKIVDSDGKTLVNGSSSVTVTVKGKYSTKVTTSDDNKVSDPAIDRTAFDSYYSTSTTFGKNSGSTGADSSTSTMNKSASTSETGKSDEGTSESTASPESSSSGSSSSVNSGSNTSSNASSGNSSSSGSSSKNAGNSSSVSGNNVKESASVTGISAEKKQVTVRAGKTKKVRFTVKSSGTVSSDDITAKVSKKKVKISKKQLKGNVYTVTLKGKSKGRTKLTVKAGGKKASVKIKVS